jgi:hypothetical protein
MIALMADFDFDLPAPIQAPKAFDQITAEVRRRYSSNQKLQLS